MLVSEELKEKNIVSQVGIKNYKKEPNENSGAEKYSDYMKNWLEGFLTDWSKQKNDLRSGQLWLSSLKEQKEK